MNVKLKFQWVSLFDAGFCQAWRSSCGEWEAEKYVNVNHELHVTWWLDRETLHNVGLGFVYIRAKATATSLPDRFIRISIFTAGKRSLRRLYFYTCLSVILFTGGGSASVHVGTADSLWEHTPPGSRLPPGSRPPLGADPPGYYHPLHSACWEIRPTSGRYASYWNAYLFKKKFALAFVECKWP